MVLMALLFMIGMVVGLILGFALAKPHPRR